MLAKKITHVVVLGTVTLGGLLVTGCASTISGDPYALTGDRSTISAADQKERQRYTDDKGRYRSDLRVAGLPPLRNVP